MDSDGKRINGNNRGFTLVEVLVAVALLSLMLGPILSSFVSVARVNATSRKRLTATTIAESVMESVKSFELKDVAKQCNYPALGFTLVAGDLEKKTPFSGSAVELMVDGDGNLAQRTSALSVTRSGSNFSFNPNAEQTYRFMITNIAMAGAEYDAVITYVVDSTKSNLTFTDGSGTEISVNTTLDSFSVRALNYYDVSIDVYKSVDGTVNSRLAEYKNEKPLAALTGTKADYN